MDEPPLAWWGPTSSTLAVALFMWQASLEHGWFEAAFGPVAAAFWTAMATWFVLSVFAIRARQYWWVIPTAPFAIYPLFMTTVMIAACARGNCV